jgi:hypothetical protein
MSGSGKNFFAAFYDRIAAVVGALALAGGVAFFVASNGDDPEAAAAAAAQSVQALKPAKTGVAPLDLAPYAAAVRLVKSPTTVTPLAEKDASFLASERRVFCKKCRKVIPGDIKACPACPFCGEKQEEEKKVVLDADGDGLPDEWERKYGLNPGDPNDANADADGDGFTNLEEFLAKTDPKDPKDHPDYLDSLAVTLPLKATYLPFVFTRATKIPSGWRCEFFNPSLKDDYGRPGRTVSAVIGEEIGKGSKNPSGYVLKAYEKKEEKHERKGMKGLFVAVDVSEATVERKSDGKTVKLVLAQDKKTKPQPVDVMATLTYTRGEVKTFDVVPGAEIALNLEKFKVVSVTAVGKGAKVVLQSARTGRQRTLEALAQ